MAVLDSHVKVFHYFEEITKIPHGSDHEEAIADFVENFAVERNLEVKRDTMDNVVIYKKATQGYEDHESIMLQAHMDMVCTKAADSTHNFETDPLELHIENGWLYANHTTLGADDGLGVALMLALLDDETLNHPDMVCVFTVQEETGLYGAKAIDPSWLKSNRLISLDGDMFGETTVSSCGYRDDILTKKLKRVSNNNDVYKITVDGLLGGHSGDAINKERGNATLIVVRLLMHLIEKGVHFRLVDLNGGEKPNAIPAYASATIATNSDIHYYITKFFEDIKYEYRFSDPDMKVRLENVVSDYAYSKEDTWNIINCIYLSPKGVQAYSTLIDKLPEYSLNLGTTEIVDDELILTYSLRGTLVSQRDEMSTQLSTLALLCGFDIESVGDGPGWSYDPDSKLREAFKEEFEKMFDVEMKEVATHGGLETGIFVGYNPALDIVTFGATALDIHTENEHMNLSTLKDAFRFLHHFLGTL